MKKNNSEELFASIKEKTYIDGEKIKLNCAAAFKIAEQFGVKLSEIGSICNDHNIRISRCQLGCF